jgi:hypothetical protein
MSQPGKFIISFDCEGKWGMADHMAPELAARLTSRSLEKAYERLISILDQHRLQATFAFVGAFTLDADQYPKYKDQLLDAQVNGRSWLDAFRHDASRGSFDGWLVPNALRKVRDSGRHELGTHGFTHVPLDPTIVGETLFRHEITSACRLADSQKWSPRTIIYPRNRVGWADLLSEFGIIGYRGMKDRDGAGAIGKMRSLAEEFGLNARSQEGASAAKGAVRIPSGHILNFWHNWERRMIPRTATLRRWSTMVNDAVRTGGTVHLWSHPHNFITDPGLYAVLEQILVNVAALQREGRLLNITQEMYSVAVKQHPNLPNSAAPAVIRVSKS